MASNFMNTGSSQARWLILLSYIIALAFDTMASLEDATVIIPPISLMVLLYWCAHFLDRTHLFSAFILGLLADSLYQTTLGAHALVFSVLAFLMLRHRSKFKVFPVWRQAFSIGAYMMLHQILNYIIFSPVLDSNDAIQFWSMPAIAIIIWPLLSLIFRRITTNVVKG